MARLVTILTVALCLVGCRDRAFELSEEGDRLFFERHYQTAARQFEIVLHECGDRPNEDIVQLKRSTLRKLGEIRQYYLNDPDGALAAYAGVAELSRGTPEGFEARLKMVRLLKNRMNDPSRAIAELESLLDAYPNQPGIESLHLELAQLAFRSRRYAVTLTHATAALRSKDDSLRIDAAMLVASSHEVEDRIDEAIKTYQKALQMPGAAAFGARLRFELAHAFEMKGDYATALEHYRRAKEEGSDATLVQARIERVTKRLEITTQPRPKRGGFHAARNAETPPTPEEIAKRKERARQRAEARSRQADRLKKVEAGDASEPDSDPDTLLRPVDSTPDPVEAKPTKTSTNG